MIKDFDKKDSRQLIDLWNICFGDEREFIESFFAHFQNEMKVGVRFEDGRIVSALYCLPAQLKYCRNTVDAWYVYAVATLPEYRKRGFSSGLLNELKTLDDGKTVLFLTPDSEENRSFYKKLGFDERFFNCQFEFKKRQEAANAVFKKRKDESLSQLREQVLKDVPHVSWSDNHLNFAYSENVYIVCESGDPVGFLHLEKTSGGYEIDEFCVEREHFEDVLNKACEVFETKKIKVSAYYGEKCCKNSKGMIYCKFDSMYKDMAEKQFCLGANLE